MRPCLEATLLAKALFTVHKLDGTLGKGNANMVYTINNWIHMVQMGRATDEEQCQKQTSFSSGPLLIEKWQTAFSVSSTVKSHLLQCMNLLLRTQMMR